jgi:hypothetical protein
MLKRKIGLLLFPLFAFIGAMIILSQTGIAGSPSAMDIHSYQGTWYEENYQLIEYNGTACDSGAIITLISANGKTKNSIEITYISAPPACRVAHIEADIKMINVHEGAFNFDDDDWGDTGQGTIQFENDKIVVTIQLLHSTSDNWGMFSGQKIFIRKKS